MKKRDSSKPSNRNLDREEVLRRAAALCARQEQCRSHIHKKLLDWGLQEGKAQEVLKQLEKENFLSDERYARAYAKDKFRFNGWGKVKIAHMLRARQIGEQHIRQALDEIDHDSYKQSCLSQLRVKNRTLRAGSDFERRAKLFRYASGKGFEADLIYPLLDHLGMEEA